ncbi:MAG: DNA polymerase III subunit chi [Rhodocyclaceae bacterium]|nr:DNA polymerase III subunit chi [Rhodocyclaceae bacterium]
MTRILFLHGAADRTQAAVQWLHAAWARREAVLVYAPEAEAAERLDRLLWTQPQLSFTPHCGLDSPLAAETPIVFAPHLDAPPQEECLLNFSNELPPGFSRFAQLIEIVSVDDADRLPARERFKFYRDRGYPLESQDISAGLP